MRDSSKRYLEFISENTSAFDDLPSIEQLKARCFLWEPGRGDVHAFEDGNLYLFFEGKKVLGYQKAFAMQGQAYKHLDDILLWEMEPACGHAHCVNITHWKFKEDAFYVNQKVYSQLLKQILREEQELQWPEKGPKSLLRYQNRVRFMLTEETGEGCWKPKKGIQATGFSRMSLQGKQYSMNQAAYMLFRHSRMFTAGEITWEEVYNPDKSIHHTCPHSWCCNPDHMTQEDIPVHLVIKDPVTGQKKLIESAKKRPRGRALSENLTASFVIDRIGREGLKDIFFLIDKVKGMSPVEVLDKYKISLTTYNFIFMNQDKFKALFQKEDEEAMLQ